MPSTQLKSLETHALNYSAVCEHVNALAPELTALGEQITAACAGTLLRSDFRTWFRGWLQALTQELSISLQGLEQIETGVLSKLASIEERQAAKDAVDLQELLKSINSSLQALSETVDTNMRYGHLWKFWTAKLAPLEKELRVSARKFRIATAGL